METNYYKMTKEQRNEVTSNYFHPKFNSWDNNPVDLKEGDLAWFLGYSATTYKLFKVVKVETNIDILRSLKRLVNGKRFHISYTLVNIKSNGETGNITRSASAYNHYFIPSTNDKCKG